MMKDNLVYCLGSGEISIGTGLFIGSYGMLTFQRLKNKKKLGAKVKKSDLTGTTANILFSGLSDIDNLVERLLELRSKVEEANAADDSTNRYIKQPRKIPRKGKKR